MMNCHAIRKFLYAFADNQLSIKANCEVLDHLKMCPACSRLVDEHQSLRAAIGKQLSGTEAPASLRRRILAATQPSSIKATATRRISWRLGMPIAIAAGIGLAFFTQWGRDPMAVVQTPHEQVPVVVEGGQVAASLVAAVHEGCCAAGDVHHNRQLPRSLPEVARAISTHFNDRIVAIAPNLSPYGFEFESAGYCGVREPQSNDGGHVIYASADGRTKLSIFSVPRWDRLDQCAAAAAAGFESYREYRLDEPGTQQGLSVLAWHLDSTTYVCCGDVDLTKLKQMVGAVRTVQGGHKKPAQVVSTYGVH